MDFLSGQDEVDVGKRRVRTERLKDRRAVRFKAHRTEADWLTERSQENGWAEVMMTERSLPAWESRSAIKNRLAGQIFGNPGP